MLQTSLAIEKPRAKDLFCIFSLIANKYSKLRLRPCKTKEKQTWRYADTATTTYQLKSYVDYIPELKLYLYSHSICENIITNSDDFVHEENDELYTKTRCMESYERTIAALQQLEEHNEVIAYLKNLFSSEFNKNKKLVEQWDSRYSDQD
ncbi:14878_t:CDS:2, partial [Dentiscutata erythropus]